MHVDIREKQLSKQNTCPFRDTQKTQNTHHKQQNPMSATNTMKAVRIHSHGGPEVLSYEDAPIPKVEAGKVLIKNHVSGVNYIDIYHRTGNLFDDAIISF